MLRLVGLVGATGVVLGALSTLLALAGDLRDARRAVENALVLMEATQRVYQGECRPRYTPLDPVAPPTKIFLDAAEQGRYNRIVALERRLP